MAFNGPTGNTFEGGFVNSGATPTVSAIYANNTSGSAFGTGTVSIGANSATSSSTLAGSFTTSGATSMAGCLSPGNTPSLLSPTTAGTGAIGTAAFNTSLTLSSGTTNSLYLEIAGNVSRDQIIVGGTIILAGTVNLATINGYVVQAGDTFDFIDASTFVVNGMLTFNTTGVAFANGVSFDTSHFGIDGTVLAVPEPGTWAAVALGLGALGGVQFARRRRS